MHAAVPERDLAAGSDAGRRQPGPAVERALPGADGRGRPEPRWYPDRPPPPHLSIALGGLGPRRWPGLPPPPPPPPRLSVALGGLGPRRWPRLPPPPPRLSVTHGGLGSVDGPACRRLLLA